MNPIALNHAQTDLSRARAALERLENAGSLDAAADAWTDFLTAAGRIFTKLEQGAKTNGKSSHWFGLKKHARKTDPLLAYIHHARNSIEHALEDVTNKDDGGIGINFTKGGFSGDLHLDTRGPTPMFDYRSADPENIPILKIIRPHLRLLSVRDMRAGRVYMPPTTHLGQIVDDRSPAGVARLALRFVEQMVTEAAALPR